MVAGMEAMHRLNNVDIPFTKADLATVKEKIILGYRAKEQGGSHRPEATGLSERQNAFLITQLQRQLGNDPRKGWDSVLQDALYALNQRPPYGLGQLYQADNDLPVHLKGGATDNILYRVTMGLCLGGTAYSLYCLGWASFPHKK
nr:PREDICTED: uncharacterized protein LOC103561571 [Equus przewalskii]